MFVLIGAALLFSVRCSSAAAGASLPGTECRITLNEQHITAEAGLCIVVPCHFIISNFTVKSVIWSKCSPEKQCDSHIFNSSNINKSQTGRVSLLESDLSKKNCSIIINDLTESDSGSYQLKVLDEKQNGHNCTSMTNISVTDLSQKPTVMIPPLTAGQPATLTCTAPGLCSGSVPTITWLQKGTGEKITGNNMTESLRGVTQRNSSTLTFTPSAEQHGTQVTCKVIFTGNKTAETTVTLNVTHIKITGNTAVKEGDALNLTCSVEGFPPSIITLIKPDNNKEHTVTKTDLQKDTGTNPMNATETKGGTDQQNETGTLMQNKTRTATFLISNMREKHSGRYTCTAKHLNTTLTAYADVTVTRYPRILKDSRCEMSSQSKAVTCVCLSQGIPLPTIRWPLLENHTEYTVITTVSKHTVNSNVTVSVTDHSETDFKCVSSNGIVSVEVNLTLTINDVEQDDLLRILLNTVKQPQVIIAFLIGILPSAIICCLAIICHRKKQKSSGNLAEMLELETIDVIPLIDAGQVVEYGGIANQEGAEGGAEAAGHSAPDGDVEYSNIDFSMLKRKNPTEETQDTTETDYAEIKREEPEERQDNGWEEGEMLEGNEEEAMIEEHMEIKKHMPAEEEGGEDVAMYSNVNEILRTI